MDTLLYDVRDGVAFVTLNRPQVLNALNLAMRDELWAALDAIEADPDVGVVLFRGAGERAYSAGADISEFGTSPSFDAARRARLERDLWGRMLHFDKPMIAAIHGYALGAGCEMTMYCDLRLASDDARFGLPETTLGYLPTAGGSQTLPRFIGQGRALDMILGTEPITAAQAFECGLLQWVGPRSELDAMAEAWARRLLALDPQVLRLARVALRRGIELPLAQGLELEARLRDVMVAQR
jgi:enoyl-CoA hydratase/carnithine racemase